MKIVSNLWLLIALFTGISTVAQLPDFTINVSSVPQTCLGNGSLTFTVNGNNPEASMEFAVYLLPNTTTPVTTVTAPVASGLVSGSYLVVATQTLNNNSNTASGNATIVDNTVPLVYTATAALCGSTGTITINVTSGTAVGYEIIAGPVVVLPQSSNIFTGLPAGQYQVRVYDNCGDGLVTTVQLQAPVTGLFFYGQEFPYAQLPSCNTITVRHIFSTFGTGAQILWPLTFQYTVHPPTGNDVVVTQLVTTGNSIQDNIIETALPFYNNQPYNYDVVVTDTCGNVFTFNNFLVNRKFDFISGPGTDSCNDFYLGFELTNYQLPCTVTFLSAPNGFNPVMFNASHPNIDLNSFTYGSDNNPVPLGVYNIMVTDACGRSATKEIEVLGEGIPLAYGGVSLSDCLGIITIKTSWERDIVSVAIVAAPAGYPAALPQDVSQYIDGYMFTMGGLPYGQYELLLVDECGNSHSAFVTIIPAPVDPFVYTYELKGCEEGEGSITLSVPGSSLAAVVITQGPASLGQALPFDISDHISPDGLALYIESLPAGSYTFSVTDQCGNVRTTTIAIEGYNILSEDIQIVPNCGSFDVDLHYVDNSQSANYWLQKFNEVTQSWEHPATGVPFFGAFNITSAIKLYNNQLNVNNGFTGVFRIVQTFNVYSNTICSHEIYNFTYTGQPEIIGAYAFPCTDGLAEVILDAVGTAPLEYAITSKDGMPFSIDNAQSNVFLSLPEATYNFQVTDACNNVINIIYDITALSPLEITSDGFCNGEDSSFWVPQYSFLTYEWWEESQPDVILSTTNTLNFPDFDPDVSGGAYIVRIVSTTPGSCIDLVLAENTAPAVLPNAGGDTTIALCRVGQINLSNYINGASQQDGLWQELIFTGALDDTILDTDLLEPGTYHFTYTVSFCDYIDEATLTLQLVGNNSFDLQLQAGCEMDAYTISLVNLEALGAVQSIEWTGPDNFSYSGPQADITGLKEGTYTVTVINAEGCFAAANIPVASTNCTIPKGVSPNGDGFNDSFNLSGLNIKNLTIFNRYGLQVYERAMYIDEWYGQSDKGELTTGTYYYVIMLASGKQVTGWVYLQRGDK